MAARGSQHEAADNFIWAMALHCRSIRNLLNYEIVECYFLKDVLHSDPHGGLRADVVFP